MRPLHLTSDALGECWAILPEARDAMLRMIAVDRPLPEPTAGLSMFDFEEAPSVTNGIAVIPITGVIFPEDGSPVADAIRAAGASNDVSSILLKVNSPGGVVSATQTIAQAIADVRGVKPIASFVNGMAASGAYWIVSGTDRITVTPSAALGSIGVVAGFLNFDGLMLRIGVRKIEVVSSQSPKKRPDPDSPPGRAQIQVLVDDIAEVFIAAVAAGRGVSTQQVIERFGGGDVMISGKAIAAGMADALGSFEVAAAGLRTAAPAKPASKVTATATTVDESGDAGATTVEGTTMPENKETTTAAPAITRDFLNANHADLVTAIQTEAATAAATAERARIKSIIKLGAKGHEKLVGECIDDPKCTVGDAAQKILEAKNAPESRFLETIEADATETEGVRASSGSLDVDSADKAAEFVLSAGKTRKQA